MLIELIADILLASGAIGAAVYCVVLSRRLRRFNDLEKGVGGAVAMLSAQVDDLTKMLGEARNQVTDSSSALGGLTDRAETVARRLELMVASLHDLPDQGKPAAAKQPAKTAPTEEAQADPFEMAVRNAPPPEKAPDVGLCDGNLPGEPDAEIESQVQVLFQRSRQASAV